MCTDSSCIPELATTILNHFPPFKVPYNSEAAAKNCSKSKLIIQYWIISVLALITLFYISLPQKISFNWHTVTILRYRRWFNHYRLVFGLWMLYDMGVETMGNCAFGYSIVCNRGYYERGNVGRKTERFGKVKNNCLQRNK